MSCLRLGGGLDGLQASVQFVESLRCTDIGPQAAVMLGTDVSVARCGPQQRYQRKSAVRLSVEQTWSMNEIPLKVSRDSPGRPATWPSDRLKSTPGEAKRGVEGNGVSGRVESGGWRID